MSNVPAALTLHYANLRNEGEQGTRYATTRTNLNPKATAAERQAHIFAACIVAGLSGDYTAPEGVVVPKIGDRKMEVLWSNYRGESYTEGAAATFMSVATFKKHQAQLHQAFGVGTKVELVVEAVRCGLLPAVPAPEAPAPAPRRRSRRQAPAAE